ncbi:hypothetical protein AN189_17630 [Loktanella sp. 3ANDIMAR09]|uniref:phage tail terminator-like protein n=1 Tax=Loktanella sp. 3ANDIMAR09 TaxID=1225657 RepID=UPI0006FFAC4C|nr:phage tail terminator-like protein [Loktanella sp. 3ANDIMAR09]KQI67044.1 hypothetical protein AN189_17630 [Loktanella sp. 3ANDIMAR09]
MTPEAAITVALTTRAETLSYTLIYPSVGDDRPDGEYVEVRHLPNETERRMLKASDPIERQGIYQLTLCSPAGQYPAVYDEKAGAIASAFGRAALPAVDGVTVHIVKAAIAQGTSDGKHWRVPVSIYYRTHA